MVGSLFWFAGGGKGKWGLPRKGKTAGFSSVDFEGEIEVVDAELLSKGLFDGIGPSKAFGCGLLLVRRV